MAKKKTNKALLLVFIGVVLISLIAVTYAFFSGGVTTTNEQTVASEAGTMRLIMNDGNTGWSEVWDFGESKSKTFTLQNTGSLPVTVDLYWKNLVNTFLESSMVYSLKQTTDTSVETYLVGSSTTFENIPTSTVQISNKKIASNITVPANKTYTYTLTIQLVNSPTVDQTADLNSNFYTEFDIKEYEPPKICHWENNQFVDCPNTFNIGDRIAIGDEVFRFIRYTSTSSNLNECEGETGISTACGDATNGDIRALAEYNLYVGHIYDSNYNKTGDIATTDPKYGKQDSTARGYVDGADYFTGTTEFSSDNVKGTQYTSYTGSIVEDYVEEYVQYLSDEYDATVSGGLITKYEIMSLCNLTGSGTCANTNPWVYTTSYWSGSPSNTSRVWCVDSIAYFNYTRYYNDGNFGVRPVITIPASYFN